MRRYTLTKQYPKQTVTQSHPVSPREWFKPTPHQLLLHSLFSQMYPSSIVSVQPICGHIWMLVMCAGDTLTSEWRNSFSVGKRLAGLEWSKFGRKAWPGPLFSQVRDRVHSTPEGLQAGTDLRHQSKWFQGMLSWTLARYSLYWNRLWSIHTLWSSNSTQVLGLVLEQSEDHEILFSSYLRLLYHPGIQLWIVTA